MSVRDCASEVLRKLRIQLFGSFAWFLFDLEYNLVGFSMIPAWHISRVVWPLPSKLEDVIVYHLGRGSTWRGHVLLAMRVEDYKLQVVCQTVARRVTQPASTRETWIRISLRVSIVGPAFIMNLMLVEDSIETTLIIQRYEMFTIRMVFVRISGGGPARSGKLKTRCGGMRRALRGQLRGGFLTALGDPGRSPSNTASTCSWRFEGRASGGMHSIREGGKRGPLGARIVPPVLLASGLCRGVAGIERGAEDRQSTSQRIVSTWDLSC
ncbi:predicted protein [Postia placenta Mad-698-R]|nr:predicted protein [Postia placenta Mad-698-R]